MLRAINKRNKTLFLYEAYIVVEKEYQETKEINKISNALDGIKPIQKKMIKFEWQILIQFVLAYFSPLNPYTKYFCENCIVSAYFRASHLLAKLSSAAYNLVNVNVKVCQHK